MERDLLYEENENTLGSRYIINNHDNSNILKYTLHRKQSLRARASLINMDRCTAAPWQKGITDNLNKIELSPLPGLEWQYLSVVIINKTLF